LGIEKPEEDFDGSLSVDSVDLIGFGVLFVFGYSRFSTTNLSGHSSGNEKVLKTEQIIVVAVHFYNITVKCFRL